MRQRGLIILSNEAILEEINSEINSEPLENQAQAGKNGTRQTLRFLADLLETLILSVVLFVGINAITARVRVDGSSMDPTLNNGEFVLVNKLGYVLGKPERGDVIVFYFPRDPNQEYIKRLVGLPGDVIKVNDKVVTINGQQIQEDYIAAAPLYNGEWTVPDGHYFVLGDNRNNSYDSHNWGPVPADYVVGKAILVYWPFKNFGLIEHTPLAAYIP